MVHSTIQEEYCSLVVPRFVSIHGVWWLWSNTQIKHSHCHAAKHPFLLCYVAASPLGVMNKVNIPLESSFHCGSNGTGLAFNTPADQKLWTRTGRVFRVLGKKLSSVPKFIDFAMKDTSYAQTECTPKQNTLQLPRKHPGIVRNTRIPGELWQPVWVSYM